MKIEILKSCSGYNFSFKQGDTVDAEDFIAKDLIKCGFAVAIKQDNAETEKAPTAKKKSAKKKAVSGNVDT